MKKCIACVLVLFLLARLYYYATDDFRISNITYELPFHPEWATPSMDPALKKRLTQKFTYLGKGAQVYAFLSEDGSTVLKFFKFKHIRPSLFIEWMPDIAFKREKLAKKAQKVFNIFKGYKIAYDHDRENTGLLYLHLNQTDDLHTQVTLIDKIGLKHSVNLDQTVFVLQKRGKTLRHQLAEDLTSGNFQLAEKHIQQILSMYLEEYKKGVFDRDHGVPQNSGFVDGNPFHLDVGKFSFGEEFKQPAFYERDLTWVALKIRIWLQKHYPDYVETLSTSIQEFLSFTFSHPIDLNQAQKTFERDRGKL